VHLSEGVLAPQVLAVSWGAAAVAIGVGVKKMSPAAMPRVAVLAAAFFVVSLIRVPLGPAAAHLVLNGVMGVLLGWCVFPALAAALLLQAVFFGFGGLTSLAANVLIMGGAAAVARGVFVLARSRRESPAATAVRGALAGASGIAVGTALLAGALAASGREFSGVVVVLVAAHLPVAAVEAAVAAAVLWFLARVAPEQLPAAKVAGEVDGDGPSGL
jgi:cobalt/nickel transport system permease protein